MLCLQGLYVGVRDTQCSAIRHLHDVLNKNAKSVPKLVSVDSGDSRDDQVSDHHAEYQYFLHIDYVAYVGGGTHR